MTDKMQEKVREIIKSAIESTLEGFSGDDMAETAARDVDILFAQEKVKFAEGCVENTILPRRTPITIIGEAIRDYKQLLLANIRHY